MPQSVRRSRTVMARHSISRQTSTDNKPTRPFPRRVTLSRCRAKAADCIVSTLYLSTQEIADRANDPVITIAPDRVFFEAFSRDESTYARLTLTAAALTEVEALHPGCTNIDFTESLRQGLLQMRSTRPAYLEVQRDGVAMQVGDRTANEARIALPDGWVQGFLVVQAALRLPAVPLTVHPQDQRHLLAYLKQRKATILPRRPRFRLEADAPPEGAVEPWHRVCSWARSRHGANQPEELISVPRSGDREP